MPKDSENLSECRGKARQNLKYRENTMKTQKYVCLLALALGLVLAGCKDKAPLQTEPLRDSVFALDTIVSVAIYDSKDEEILKNCLALASEYEKLLSRTIEGSDIDRINTAKGASVEVDIRTVELIARGLYYGDLSGGRFDISVAPASILWNFKTDAPALPDVSALERAVALIDYKKVHVDGKTIQLKDGDMEIELGAIAKGYIADRMADYLREQGVKSAIIDLGGNIYALGTKPDGNEWRIGVQSPFKERGNEIIGNLYVQNKSVVTSGIYERYFVLDGTLYHHILNTETGYPVESELSAVTIVSDLSVDGDGISTTVFALGLEEGLALIERLPGVEAVFITKDGTVQISSGLTLYPVE